MKIRIGKWMWTVQPWEKALAEILGAVIWTAVCAGFGMMVVSGIVSGHAM